MFGLYVSLVFFFFWQYQLFFNFVIVSAVFFIYNNTGYLTGHFYGHIFQQYAKIFVSMGDVPGQNFALAIKDTMARHAVKVCY